MTCWCNTRPGAVLRWATEMFGDCAVDRGERAARLIEEALEVVQAEGMPRGLVNRIADRVYSRPPGQLAQEIGGLAITLDALAQNAGLSVQAMADREYERITSLPKAHWQRKHGEKIAAGTADMAVRL